MSYILEALRKAERERQLSEAPSLPEILSVQPVRRRNWLPWLAALLLLAVNCVLVWHFLVNGKNDIKPPEPSAVTGKSVKPIQPLSPKAEHRDTLISTVKNPAPPPVNPVGQTGKAEVSTPPVIVKPTEKPLAMPAPYQAKQPAPSVEPRQAAPSKPEPTLAPPALGEASGKPMAGRTREEAAQTIEKNQKPLISEERLASVKMMTGQRDEGQEQDLNIPVPTSKETLRGTKDNAHIKINVLAYSNNPAERFAVINMVKYSKGDRLPGGEILQDIQADGVVLEFNGRRFMVGNR